MTTRAVVELAGCLGEEQNVNGIHNMSTCGIDVWDGVDARTHGIRPHLHLHLSHFVENMIKQAFLTFFNILITETAMSLVTCSRIIQE